MLDRSPESICRQGGRGVEGHMYPVFQTSFGSFHLLGRHCTILYEQKTIPLAKMISDTVVDDGKLGRPRKSGPRGP